MSRFGKAALIVVALIVVAVAGFLGFAWKPQIEAQATPPSFDQALIDHGAALAMIGNCSSCHSAPGGTPYTGGLAVPTPFGTVYSTNITPDPETGIGLWSEAAFRRALHEGVNREGDHLYPAFPFDHFRHASDEDIAAVYAYLMSLPPTRVEPMANQLAFPLGFRPLVAGWKLLYLPPAGIPVDPNQSEAWNRGRYLVEGLGHCSSCHTPRNALGAEEASRPYTGAEIEGWYAFPLDASSPAPTGWDVESLTAYLRSGFVESHGTARGPMAEVAANLRNVSDDDIVAMATYVAWLMGSEAATTATAEAEAPRPTAPQTAESQTVPKTADAQEVGAMIYAATCSSCHESGRPQPYGGLQLRRSTALNAETPQNIVNMVLYGLPATEGEPGPVMPGFAGAIDADQLVALLDYLRASFTDQPAWTNTRQVVDDTLAGTTQPQIYSTDGVRRDPMTPVPRTAS